MTITVVGRTRAPVTRGRAEPGDRLWVTGSLGELAPHWRHGDGGGAAPEHGPASPIPSPGSQPVAGWLGMAPRP